MKRFIDCGVGTFACNLRCHYCYVAQNYLFTQKIPDFKYPAEVVGQSLSKERLLELDAIAWERGTANVQPSSNHRNSDVVLIILTAHAGEDALAQVKKCRHYQSYLWGFHGWSNYRLIVVELSSGRIVHNRHGQILKKFVKKAMIN